MKYQFTERANGTPVTIIADLCKGDKEIATLKIQRDIAEVDYKANLEAINVYKKVIDVRREQINREWNRKD